MTLPNISTLNISTLALPSLSRLNDATSGAVAPDAPQRGPHENSFSPDNVPQEIWSMIHGSVDSKTINKLHFVNKLSLERVKLYCKNELIQNSWLPEWAFDGIAENQRNYCEFYDMMRKLDERCRQRILTLQAESTEISQLYFFSCESLTEPPLPPSLKIINENAFAYCSNLALKSLPANLTTIKSNAFEHCEKLALTSLPRTLESIGDWTFHECKNLELTSLPENLTTISEGAFCDCKKLALTSLPENLTTIQDFAFAFCSDLNLTSLPPKLMTIGKGAFFKCEKLKEPIKQQIMEINANAFLDFFYSVYDGC